VGDRHGGALLDLHEGLALRDKETAFGEVGRQRWQWSRGSGQGRRRAGAGHIHALGQALEGSGELGGEVAGGRERIPLTGIEPVVAAPGAEHHRGMLKKVPVDRALDALDGEGDGLQPGRVRVGGRLAGGALAQAQDVRDHTGALAGEGLRRQADGAQEIRLLREMSPQAGVLLV
jgi:hypothetical protein